MAIVWGVPNFRIFTVYWLLVVGPDDGAALF